MKGSSPPKQTVADQPQRLKKGSGVSKIISKDTYIMHWNIYETRAVVLMTLKAILRGPTQT
jgi:hypothetical protein